jgi:hypothetical protein
MRTRRLCLASKPVLVANAAERERLGNRLERRDGDCDADHAGQARRAPSGMTSDVRAHPHSNAGFLAFARRGGGPRRVCRKNAALPGSREDA